MKCFKLTDHEGQSYNGMQWGEGTSHEVPFQPTEEDFCTNRCIHFYCDLNLAVLLNPIHSNFKNPIVWEAEAEEPIINDKGLKYGTRKLTTLKRVVIVPSFSLNQVIYFGILCAKEVCKNPKWNYWADNWISGKDRRKKSASAASYVVYATSSYATYAAASGYAVSGYAAAASYASYAAASYTDSASAYTASASAASAASFAKSIKFPLLANQALEWNDPCP